MHFDSKTEDGVRDWRERLHRLGAHQDAAGAGIRREDDGQEPRFGSPFVLGSVFHGLIQLQPSRQRHLSSTVEWTVAQGSQRFYF